MKTKYYCDNCGVEKLSSKGTRCKPCGYIGKKRPSGLAYKIVKDNPTWFKKGVPHPRPKGIIPWNKDIKGIHLSPDTEFKKGQGVGIENTKWKGDKVGYFALHTYMKRNFKWDSKCTVCGDDKHLVLSNKDFLYTRDPSTWWILCHKCHMEYDSKNGWGKARKRFEQ